MHINVSIVYSWPLLCISQKRKQFIQLKWWAFYFRLLSDVDHKHSTENSQLFYDLIRDRPFTLWELLQQHKGVCNSLLCYRQKLIVYLPKRHYFWLYHNLHDKNVDFDICCVHICWEKREKKILIISWFLLIRVLRSAFAQRIIHWIIISVVAIQLANSVSSNQMCIWFSSLNS